MQEDFRLIVDLVSVLAVAACGGLFAALLKQPVLLGYLIGGMVVGPAGLGLIKEVIQVETLAQFGVAFLLFALGVEFSFAELKKVKAIALGGGGLQIALTILTTVLVCGLTGAWGALPAKGVFLGSILSLSSTAVVLKCLMERNETETPHGQVMLGILVVQDLALGLMLAVLPALHEPGEVIGMAVLTALVRIGLFAAGAVAAGIWVIPPLLRLLARTESRELFLLGVVALCLGIALLTESLGLSIEMGAFVAGLMISEVEYADQTLTYVEPLRDIFASLFFAAIGMLIDPVFLLQNIELILGLVALVFLGKFLIITPLVKLFRYPLKTALIAGLGLAQIGEFSFVLASEGQALGLVSRRIYLLILGTTAVTLMLTPFVLRLLPSLFNFAESIPWLKPYISGEGQALDISEDLPFQDHIVVCGYGRVGKNLVKLLQQHNVPVVVIDQSESRIQQLRDGEIPYVYGNCVSLHVLETAGVSHAKGMAIALPDPMSTRLCVKRALELCPELDLVVRATQDKNIELLYQLGAREVVQPEFEASIEMATHLLTDVGWTSGLLQQEMQQIRSDHYLDFRPERNADEVSRHLQQATQDLNRRWYDLPVDSPLIGMNLEEADMRYLTGVSLMAIRRANGEEIDYPNNQTKLAAGDRLLIVGANEELAALEEFAQGKVAVPGQNSACQWVAVDGNSAVLGKTLKDLPLDLQSGIKVQAMRRDGKFIRSPHDNIDLRTGDQVLLCGSLSSLNQIQPLFAVVSEIPLAIPLVKAKETEVVKEMRG
ncbi:Kef-type potassium/proton antiporter, CPA2 family [Trichormus variabilis ATCC 29413]|uniref:Kef-type potassium/proton antiporter, CPA2 family n=2 Tax=Anabaena variabilis TaxID=264691 RepID=Q3M8J1_TRIV2|nr:MULTISPECIES: cation:proton antiporter [Nostocaceae]ABA22695.1 Kef-type potassium/proton antiporter, CPA2 family [Trichormus variabilis ATCC 29413]MBC1267971.1 cation:proton antiporter [Trichormus variabilis FSR]MBC1303739.1 cation:proton antiporter [Trichormus variabilis N2B]MBC1312018.1 cation:proton antiporter [Trichormus variabilis PNB]MBC1328180.1 cation:proton antiporter [Trichormus variabilis 9RC]